MWQKLLTWEFLFKARLLTFTTARLAKEPEGRNEKNFILYSPKASEQHEGNIYTIAPKKGIIMFTDKNYY